ncbi:MAG: cellulase family glycosylhydrolase [Gallionella sp.]
MNTKNISYCPRLTRTLRWKIGFAAPWLLFAQSALAASNLVTDGGFEQNFISWSSPKSALSLNTAAAFSGATGLQVLSPFNYCPNDAIYTLDARQFRAGTLYEFGARTRLAAGSVAAPLRMGIIKNGAAPIYVDGFANTSYAYGDRWTQLFGVYIANFLPTDSVKLCISGALNTPTYIDDVYVKPLTTAEIGYIPPVTLDTATLLQANGNSLVVGAAKTPVILNGINLSAYNYGNNIAGTENAIDNFRFKNHDERAYQEIAGLGYNTVRLMMSFVFFEDNNNPGVYKEEGWAWLERNILWAKKHNIRLILDMHEPPGGTQLPSFHTFNARPDIQLRLENLWVAIAGRYKNETTIAAYDLINEPYVDNWFVYAQGLISKMRAVDPNHLIIIEQSYHPNDLGIDARFYPLPFANIIYDAHYYDTFASSDTGTAPYTGTLPTFKNNLKNEFLPFYNSVTGKFTVPINIGEYGVVHQKFDKNLGAEQWLRNINDAMNYYGISRQLFNYHESRFGIYSGWNTYPGESTTTNTRLKSTIRDLNRLPLPVGTDTLPNAFGFATKTAIVPSSVVQSAPVAVSGLDAPTPITISGGQYRINSGVYTNLAGVVKNGDVVQVKHTAGAGYQASVSSQVIVGGITARFTSVTQDITPNAFSFPAQTNVALATAVESAIITVSGIDTATAIKVVNGEYSINGGLYTSLAGMVKNGDTVKIRQLPAANYATKVISTLTIGNVVAIFASTTAAKDTLPNVFSLTAQTGVPLSTPIASNIINVTGINAPTMISVSAGGAYRINGGVYTSVAGVVNLNDSVQVQRTSAIKALTATNTTLTIGGKSAIFKITTR